MDLFGKILPLNFHILTLTFCVIHLKFLSNIRPSDTKKTYLRTKPPNIFLENRKRLNIVFLGILGILKSNLPPENRGYRAYNAI